MDNYPEIKYAEIKRSLPENLDVRILAILQQHIGRDNRISRKRLVEEAFGVNMNEVDLANSTLDRQVRLALEALQSKHPILSTSGGGGYYYAGSADEIARYAAELNSRAMKLLEKSRRLERLANRFKKGVQLNLL